MKLQIFTILAAVVASVAGMAIEKDPQALEFSKRAQDPEIVETTLDDGSQRYEFFDEGELQGHIIDKGEGDVQAFDAAGEKVSIDELTESEDDESAHEKRLIPALLIGILGRVIAQYGGRAVMAFASCIGVKTIAKCADEIVGCPHPPWDPACYEAWTCMGFKVVKTCAKRM